MITILAFDELQKAAPETTITSLNTPFDGFCSIGIEPPKYIRDYFREFLSKAIEFTAGNECRIELMSEGNLIISLILPDRIYRIKTDASKSVFRIGGIIENRSKHPVILRDAAGHKKVAFIDLPDQSDQEQCKEGFLPP
jgi:hypothetical protein